MSAARRKRSQRWLAKRGTVDYGPFTTEEVKEALARKEMDLGTLLAELGTQTWQPIGVYAEFREFYGGLHERWEREAIEAEVTKHEAKLRAMDKVKGGAWKVIALATVVVLGLGAWVVYRILHAEPTGVLEAVAIKEAPLLPAPPKPKLGDPALRPAEGRKVRKLRELRNYDTAGVTAEGSGSAPVTRLSFADGEGGGAGPSQAQIDRVVRSVTPGLLRCASTAAAKSDFRGANVSFLVRSGRLGGITVSRKALKNKPFVACVKSTLRRAKAPTFSGSERRVTIPLRIR